MRRRKFITLAWLHGRRVPLRCAHNSRNPGDRILHGGTPHRDVARSLGSRRVSKKLDSRRNNVAIDIAGAEKILTTPSTGG